MSSPPDAEARLCSVPWSALDGLGPVLAPPLAAVLEGQPAERVLDRLLRAHKRFTPEQRAVCAEACFGVGLWRRRLYAQSGLGAPTPLQLLAVLARDLGGDVEAPVRLGVELPPPSAPPSDWRQRWSLPDWLGDLLQEELGDEAESFAAALNAPGPVCLRTNTARLSRRELGPRLAAEGLSCKVTPFAPHGLLVTSSRPNLYGLPSYQQGLFEVQDEGSQLLGALLPLQSGQEVLDLCAGAGGKTLQLSAAVGPDGRVHCTDADLVRLERLRTRASKAGAKNVLIHGSAPPVRTFDAVLVDAPCSELGALRRGPDLRWRIDPVTFAALEATQRELLATAARHTRRGGHLAYATCTLRRAENEAVVDEFLAAHPEFRVVRPALPGEVLDDRGFLKTLPHRHGTDGFFGALLVREA